MQLLSCDRLIYARYRFVQYAAVCHYRPFVYVSGEPDWEKSCHRVWFNKMCKIRQVKTVKN
jgi:hypothetical protein